MLIKGSITPAIPLKKMYKARKYNPNVPSMVMIGSDIENPNTITPADKHSIKIKNPRVFAKPLGVTVKGTTHITGSPSPSKSPIPLTLYLPISPVRFPGKV